MSQILASIPLFISILGLFYFLFIPNKKAPSIRFLPYIFLSFIGRGLYLVFLYYSSLFLLSSSDMASPPFTILSLSLIYLFLVELVEKKPVSKLTFWANLLPSMVGSVIYLLMLLSPELRAKLDYANYIVKNSTGLLLTCIYFCILYSKQLKQHNKQGKGDKLVSVMLLQLGFILSLFAISLVFVYRTNVIFVMPFRFLKLLEISFTLTLYFYTFKLYRHFLIEDRKRRLEEFKAISLLSTRKEKGKEETSESQEEEESTYQSEIEEFFKTSKAYLNPSFTQAQLAERLNLSRSTLSQLFNGEMGVTFSDYLNDKRIAHACELLESNPDIPVTQLAEEVGYRSRTTFYNHFKRVKGCTPKEYLEQ